MIGADRKQCCSAAAAKTTAVLSLCIAPFTLLHALSLVCAAEADLPLLKSRPSLMHPQSYGDRDLTWVSSPQNELQKILSGNWRVAAHRASRAISAFCMARSVHCEMSGWPVPIRRLFVR